MIDFPNESNYKIVHHDWSQFAMILTQNRFLHAMIDHAHGQGRLKIKILYLAIH